MNLNLLIEIAELANSLVVTVKNGNGNADATTVTSTLLQILQNGVQAYEQQTGATLDPSLIRAEGTILKTTPALLRHPSLRLCKEGNFY